MFKKKEQGALSRKDERRLKRKVKQEVLKDNIDNPIVREFAAIGVKKVIKLADNKLIEKLPESSKKELSVVVKTLANNNFKLTVMKDWKTTIVGAILVVTVAIQPIIETGVVDWKNIAIAAIIALLSYLMKDAGKETKEVK